MIRNSFAFLKKMLSASGGRELCPPDQGLCPWTQMGWNGLTKYCVDRVDHWHNHYNVLITAQSDHITRVNRNQLVVLHIVLFG